MATDAEVAQEEAAWRDEVRRVQEQYEREIKELARNVLLRAVRMENTMSRNDFGSMHAEIRSLRSEMDDLFNHYAV